MTTVALDGEGRSNPGLADTLAPHMAGPSAAVADIGGEAVHVVFLECGGRRYGALAAAVSADDQPALLAVADAAAAVLDREFLATELADREASADVGEIVGPVSHEFNNFLNTVMLQVAIMEMSASAAAKADLLALKRQSKVVAGVVKQLQRYRRRAGDGPVPADLNRAATAAADAIEERPVGHDQQLLVRPSAAAGPDDISLRLCLANGLPPVPGPAADLQRLCRFLLTGSARAVGPGGMLTLTTTPTDPGAGLRLEAIGGPAGTLTRALELPLGSDGGYAFELAACQSIVRRMGGTIRTEALADSEAIVIELPPATCSESSLTHPENRPRAAPSILRLNPRHQLVALMQVARF